MIRKGTFQSKTSRNEMAFSMGKIDGTVSAEKLPKMAFNQIFKHYLCSLFFINGPMEVWKVVCGPLVLAGPVKGTEKRPDWT
jgi:hypothetical protein